MKTAISKPTTLNLKNLSKAAGIGIGLGLLLNIVIYFLFSILGASFAVDQGGVITVVTLVPIILATIVPSILGTGVFAVFQKFVPSGPKLFIGLSVGLTLLSLGGPISGGQDVLTIIGLNLMHVATAGAIVGSLVQFATE